MRIGHNPARFVEKVDHPADLLIGVVNFIPFLSGFYAESLEVLKTCLLSIKASTKENHDLLVFDNHSCREVRNYLLDAFEEGIMQELVFSEKNIGKIGAWNFIFGSANSKYITFADSDVLFTTGWLSESMSIMNTFPNVGMVTARPYRTKMEYSAKTLEWAYKESPGSLKEGCLLGWDVFWEHARSLGYSEDKARTEYAQGVDYLVNFKSIEAFVGAGHFQFMAPAGVLKKLIPLTSRQPMRGEEMLDLAVNSLGLLRLSTREPFVSHMGNTLPEGVQDTLSSRKRKSFLKWLLWLPGIRHFLLWLNNRIFRLYFFNVE